MALFADPTGPLRTARLGDDLDGWVLHRVTRDPPAVVLRHASGAERILSLAAAGASAPARPSRPVSTRFPEIRAVSGDTTRVPRRTVDRGLVDLGSMARDARFLPASGPRGLRGFAIDGIRPGSVFSALGLVNGDVIRRVGGLDASSPENLLKISQQVRDLRDLEVELERGGARVVRRFVVD